MIPPTLHPISTHGTPGHLHGARRGRTPWRRARCWLAVGVALVALAGCLPPRKPPAPEPPPLPGKAGAAPPRRRAYVAPPPARAYAPPGQEELPFPLPEASPKDPGLLPYDEERPCFTREEMARGEAVLFLGRSRPEHRRWLGALNRAFYDLKADCADPDLLVAVLTLIQQESDVQVDPPLENADLRKLLAFKLQRLEARNPLAARVLDASGIEDALAAKLRRDGARVRLKTEGDLVRYVEDDLRVWFADYLHREFSVPAPIANVAAQIGIATPVNTIGPMQVNVEKAYRNARERGEEVSGTREMRQLLLGPETALEEGLKEGVYLFWKSYRFYRARLPAEEAAYFAGVDYNSGEFSSRNAAFQERVAALSGRKLALDGDLLLYRNGRAEELISNTEDAVKAVLTGMGPNAIRTDLLLEKEGRFSGTATARGICRRYHASTGQPCAVARLPSGADNETARVKMGRSYSPENYARAFSSRFQANRERYQASGGG